MDKKKFDIASVASEAGKGASALWNKARQSFVQAADQNNDGSFDLKDVSAIAETIGNAAKSTAAAMRTSAEERSREQERKLLQPIFLEDIDTAEFLLSKLIRITEIDKKRAESEVCRNSIGYFTEQQDMKIVNIFKDKLELFGLTCYPDCDSELYYVDPSDRDRYIALDDYFNYLRIERINELQKLAQDLGAKHFRVTYKEQKSTFSSNSTKTKGSTKIFGTKAEGEYTHETTASNTAIAEVAAEMTCPGHAPVMPKLKYLQRESSILTLIAMRMDESSPLSHQKLTINLSTSSGLKERDAIKIDAALKSMKINGNTTLVAEVQNESRRFFEYEIDF